MGEKTTFFMNGLLKGNVEVRECWGEVIMLGMLRRGEERGEGLFCMACFLVGDGSGGRGA